MLVIPNLTTASTCQCRVTSLTGICRETMAIVQRPSIAVIQTSYSGPSHFGIESCTDGPDASEHLVRMQVVGLTLNSVSGRVHDATFSTQSALSCLHLACTTVIQFYIIIVQSLKPRGLHFKKSDELLSGSIHLLNASIAITI